MLPKLPITADSGGERMTPTSWRLSSEDVPMDCALLTSRRCEPTEGRDDADPP